MSRENLEIVRSIYSAWGRGDFGSVDWADPEIEYVRADGPAPGRWKGFAEIAEAMREFMAAWEDFRLHAEEYRELEGDRVLALSTMRGRGKRSGLAPGQLGTRAAQVFHLRDGKVIRIVNYYDCDRALADLGLSPEADRPGYSS